MIKILRLAKWGRQNKGPRRANSRDKGLSLKEKSAKVERHGEKTILPAPAASELRSSCGSQRNVAVSDCTKLNMVNQSQRSRYQLDTQFTIKWVAPAIPPVQRSIRKHYLPYKMELSPGYGGCCKRFALCKVLYPISSRCEFFSFQEKKYWHTMRCALLAFKL